jgi:hypothetical protein
MPDNEEFDIGGLQRHEDADPDEASGEEVATELVTCFVRASKVLPGDLYSPNDSDVPALLVTQVYLLDNKAEITVTSSLGKRTFNVLGHERRRIRRREEIAAPATWRKGDEIQIKEDSFFEHIQSVLPREGEVRVFKTGNGTLRVLDSEVKPIRRHAPKPTPRPGPVHPEEQNHQEMERLFGVTRSHDTKVRNPK